MMWPALQCVRPGVFGEGRRVSGDAPKAGA
jgi:hypothetical protein